MKRNIARGAACLLILLVLGRTGALRAEDSVAPKPWWDYAYEGTVLPSASFPQWIPVDPDVKAGMQIRDTVQDGVLALNCVGTGAFHYYEITYSSPAPTPKDLAPVRVWDGNSPPGNTVEFRLRVPRTETGVPWSGLIGAGGMGAGKDKPFLIFLNTQGITLGSKNVPLDLSAFHLIRFTRDPAGKIDVYIDKTLVQSVQVTEIPSNPGFAGQLLFGATYSTSFQGRLEISSIHWTNAGVFPPRSDDPAAAPAAPVVPVAAAKKPSSDVDLSDPNVALAHDLFQHWPRFPAIAVPMTATPPVIDGRIDATEWKGASVFNGLVSLETNHLLVRPSSFLVEHDADNFYLAFKFGMAHPKDVAAVATGRVDSLWNKEDGVELVFSPDQQKAAIFSFFVNGNSGYSQGFQTGKMTLDKLWAGPVEFRSRVTDKGIEGEMRIPKATLEETLKAHGLALDPKVWGLDPLRVDLFPARENADWSDMWDAGTDNYEPSFLGQLLLRGDSVAVRLDDTDFSPGSPHLGGTILNGGEKPLHVRLSSAVYRAQTDVRKNKIVFFHVWDKVNRIRTTGSDVDQDAAFQLFLGENNWLKGFGQAYQLASAKSINLDVQTGGSSAFAIPLGGGSGQYVFGAKLVDRDTGETLWQQTAPCEVKEKLSIETTSRFLTAKGIVVGIEFSDAEAIHPGNTLLGTVLDAAGKTISSWKQDVPADLSRVEKVVSMEKDPPGDYVLRVQVASGGEIKVSATKHFTKPAVPSWLGNKIGYSNEIPWPFIPVKADATSVTVWGRTYTWEKDNPFPSAIVTQGHSLLAAPIRLTGTVGDQPIAWQTISWKQLPTTARTATYESIQQAGALKLFLTITVDFDGLIRFRGRLEGGGAEIDQLQLSIPLRPEMVTHFHASQFHTEVKMVQDMKGDNSKYRAGYIDTFRKSFPSGRTPFAALFWLGGNDGGLQWISEWDKGWSNPDRQQVMGITRSPDATSLEVSFVGKKTMLGEPLPIDFAVNVSPVKDPGYFWKWGTAIGPSTGYKPGEFNAEKLKADLAIAKKSGITHVMTGGYHFPFFADIWIRDFNRDHYKEVSDAIHRAGLKNYYYGCWAYADNGAESPDFGADMMKLPLETGGPETYWYNPEGPWVDFFMAGLQQAIKDFGVDGIYLDGMPVTSLCADPLLGQTYVDDQGELHGRWPIFALREWTLRMTTLMHITAMKDGLVYEHDSSAPDLAVESLADIRVVGEDIPSTDSLRDSISLDSYFARASIHAFGIPCETVWYNWWNRPLKENQLLTAFLLTGQLKNRTGASYLEQDAPMDYSLLSFPDIPLLHLFQQFDIPTAQWWPYDGKQMWISAPAPLYASSYLHPGQRAMIVIGNMDKTPIKNAHIQFDLQKAGFGSQPVKVTDGLLKTDLPIQDGAIDLDIDAERYRILILEAK